MPTLYLHIGAPKTGSTYIQSTLRLSRENLLKNGLIYPRGTEEPGLGPESLTTGNGFNILRKKGMLERTLKESKRDSHRGVVFSSEFMCFGLQDRRLCNDLVKSSRKTGFQNVKMLLFLRNPVEYAVSNWRQSVKSRGGTQEMNDYLIESKVGYVYKGALEIMNNLVGYDDIELTVLNYSVVRQDILNEVARWLGVGSETLVRPLNRLVNRSLDGSEIRLQMELNKILGPKAIILSKALCEEITDLKSVKPAPSPECQDMIWEKTRPFAEMLNRHLPEGQKIVFDRMEPTSHPKEYSFSEDQLRIIAETLGGEIKRLWDGESRVMRRARSLLSRFHRFR